MMKQSKGLGPLVSMIGILFVAVLLLPIATPASAHGANTGSVLTQLSDEMATMVDQAKPAVVNISTSKTVKMKQHPFFNDPLFKKFFGNEPTIPQKKKVSGLGSGVIATSDGYILTCNHVIEGAEDIIVKLSDNREYKGTVVGKDARTDIALIKIPETNLSHITWGDSDKLKVGELVLAIGQPFGLKMTVTMGIVSGLGRAGLGITDYEDFIQTDAAINPGNSGGALVNTRGELVGINNAIFSTSGGYQGIGFAIPSNMIKNVMDSLIGQGKVVRGWLGVQIQPLTPELSKQFGIKDENGVLLVDVVDGGPADKGGLKRGDVVVEYDGKKVDTPFALRNMVAATKIGKTVPVKVLRDGNPLTVTVTIEELPAEQQVAAGPSFDNNLKGVSVQDLTDEILQQLGITKKIKGVVVSSVDEDSPAAGILNQGDILLEVNKKPVQNVAQYNKVVSSIEKNKGILLLVVRNGASLYVTIPVAPK